jgi:photosystem II stability/assembly factor-like uncharacterized protein
LNMFDSFRIIIMTYRLFLFCLFLLPMQQVSAQWQWLNPFPEGNELFAATFIDARHGWAVGGNGAVLRSSDGGVSWTPQTNALRTTPFIGLSIEFISASTGVISMNNGALLRTTDGGYTWDVLPRTGLAFRMLRKAPDGSLWGCGNVGAIARSTDGGVSWETMNSGVTTVLYDLAFPDASTIVVTGGGGVIVRSDDGGQQWTKVSAPLAMDVISVDFADEHHGIALQLPNYLLRSSDGGQSWSDTSFAINQFTQIRFASTTTGWLLSNSVGSVFKTTDAGASWRFLEVQRPRRTTMYGVYSFNEDEALLVGNGGALFATDDGGQSWVQRGDAISRAHFRGVTALNDSAAWVFGDKSAFYTNDRGQSWIGKDTISLPGFRFGHALSETRILGAGSQGQIMLSTDAGVTWQIETLSTAGQIEDFFFVDDMNGWLAGAHGTLARSSDGGGSWEEVSAGVTHDFNGISAVSASMAWVVGDGGVIYHTTDGGENWTQQSSPAVTNLLTVEFLSSTHGWAGGQQILLRTTDGGRNWTEVTALTGIDVVYDIDFIDDDHGYFMLSRSIARTSDGGVSFYRTDYPATGLQDMSATHSGHLWIAGEFGVIQQYTPTAAAFLQPAILNFGDVAVNKSRELDFTLTNRGEVDMEIGSVATVGAGFLVADGDLSPLAPGDSRTLRLRFAPADTGLVYGLATVYSNAKLGVPFIDLVGRGVPPGTSALTHTPDTLDFGTLMLGTYATRYVILTNRGTQPLLINRQEMRGGDSTMFMVTLESTFFYAAGKTDSVQITFSPLREGEFESRLLVESNDAVEPFYFVVVRGIAITPVIRADERVIDFDWMYIDSTRMRTAVLRNAGTAPLHITDWQAAGQDAAMFHWTNPGPLTLQPGDHISLDITLQPTSYGPKSADILISSDDLTNPVYTLELRGRATTLSIDTPSRPGLIALGQNYPNPASLSLQDVTRYSIGLPTGAAAELLLYDALGRERRRIELSASDVNVATVVLPLRGLSPGVYLAVLRSNIGGRVHVSTVSTVIAR